ncbi:MAG TPA: hypothetical protein VFC50_03555 [Candidatus Dormibacteraeota bacterium]|nr:hypothetical protein [Candidatus Dormibacteraeota bacterium]
MLGIKGLKLLLAVGLFLAAGFLLANHTAYATNPATISFQGKVVNADGTNVANGSYTFIFRLYDTASPTTTNACSVNTNCWWEETDSITVTDGVFQVELGAGCAFTSACNSGHSGIDFNTNGSLYLTFKFNGDAAGFMSPTMHLTSVPYAANADKLDGIDSTAFGQLASNQTWTGTNTIQPTTDIKGLVVKQTSIASPTSDIFNVQTANSSSVIQVTGPSANNAAVLITSVGTGALTLQSGTGTISLGTTTAVNASGALSISSGGTTQTLSLATPASTSASTGAITIQSGSATVGSNLSAGTITIDTGTKTGVGTATINIGTTNATALAFGSTANNASTTFKQTASATAFQVQNASSKAVLTVDTSSNQVVLGLAGSGNVNGQLVFANNTNTNTATLTSGVTSGTYSVSLPTAGPASTSQCLQSGAVTASQLAFAGCGGTGLSRTAADTASVAVLAANNLYVLTNTSSAVASGVLKIDNGTNTSSALSVVAGANALSLTASAVPSADQLSITNAGQGVTTGDTNGLSINYVGGSAAVESAGAEVDLTPGGLTGGTWSGMRVVANATGAVSGVKENGIKLDGPGTPGAGTETGLYVGTGWDIGLDVESGDVNLTGFTSSGNPSDPASPATGNLAVYSKKVAGRMMLKIKDPSGQSTPLQPALWGNNVVLYAPTSSTTVTGGFGTLWAKGGTGGTVSTATPSTTAPAISNQIHRTKQPNVVTTTNQDMGIKISAADGDQFWTGNAAGLGGFFFQTRFVVDAWPAATARIFAGLASGTTSVAISDTVNGDVAGLWHDTTDSNTTLNMVTRNNSTTTKTPIALSNAIAAGNAYDFYMYCQENCTTIFYRLDDIVNGVTYEGSTATTLPRNTIFMGPQVEMSNGTANTVVNTTIIGVNRIYVESDH